MGRDEEPGRVVAGHEFRHDDPGAQEETGEQEYEACLDVSPDEGGHASAGRWPAGARRPPR
jgi:hypothetical protein